MFQKYDLKKTMYFIRSFSIQISDYTLWGDSITLTSENCHVYIVHDRKIRSIQISSLQWHIWFYENPLICLSEVTDTYNRETTQLERSADWKKMAGIIPHKDTPDAVIHTNYWLVPELSNSSCHYCHSLEWWCHARTLGVTNYINLFRNYSCFLQCLWQHSKYNRAVMLGCLPWQETCKNQLQINCRLFTYCFNL